MKKLKLTLIGFLALSSINAQVNKHFNSLNKKSCEQIGTVKTINPISNQKITTVWQNDFSQASDWTLASTGSAGISWEISTTPSTIPVSALSPFASGTAANGFLFVSSDANNTADNDGFPIVTTATNATPIDLSSTPVVKLKYSHNFRWWHETRGVRVSGDNGATWTDFNMSDETTYSTPNQNSANPEVTIIDISAVAGGQSQVLIQFYYDDHDYWAWYWAVDDVSIFVPEDNDLAITGAYWGSTGSWGARLPYYQIPTAQVAPIDFGGIVSNIGALDQTGVLFTAAVPSASYTSTSAAAVLPISTFDTLDVAAQFTPSATVASHVVNLSVLADATDADMANNAVSSAATIAITNYTYARDLGTIVSGSFNQGQGFEVGNIFDIYTTTDLKGVDAVISTSAVAGAEMFVKLYSIDPATGDFVFVDESLPHTLTAAELGQKVTLTFINGANTLNAGESYLVVAGSNGDGGASNDLVVGTAGSSEKQTSFYFDYTDQTWYYTTSTPMVRMNFDPVLGVKEINTVSNFSVSPNPANEVINVKLNSSASASISITDLAGKVVKNTSVNGISTTISTSGLNEGVYFVNVTIGNSTSTEKIVIKK